MGGFIVSNQFIYSGYSDYGLNYNYPNNQNNFYQKDYRPVEHGYFSDVTNGMWTLSAADQNSGVSMIEPHRLIPGSSVGIPNDAYMSSQWESHAADIQPVYNDSEDMPITWRAIRVGDRVRVNQGVRTWATTEHIKNYPAKPLINQGFMLR